jgi:nitroreductase/NAD-dependent dihydropyrimidine dehydrogenase PreA subunit
VLVKDELFAFRRSRKEKSMSLFMVDSEKCKKDRICVDECPAQIIAMKDKQALPEPIHRAEDFCIQCGHCVAVCPYGALTHEAMSPEQCPPARKELLPDPEWVEHFLRFRRSIRTYKEKPVERETIARLIDIARYAPSGSNSQPVRWHVVYDRKEVRKLAGHVVGWMRYLIKEQYEFAMSLNMDRIVTAWDAGIDRICRGAPHVIVAHAPADDRAAPAACTIALSYLDLAASSFGLGTCWAGYFHAAATMWPPMRNAVDLPERHTCFGAMMIGYPKYTYHRLPLRNEPRITWR